MPKTRPPQARKRVVAVENRRARFDVAVDWTLEAGLILSGDEIKSIRAQRAQIVGGYVRFLGQGPTSLGRPVLVGTHFALAADPERVRPLLLHQAEIARLATAVTAEGKTAVALRLYLKHGWAKVEIGVGSGRKRFQKRELLRSRAVQRDQEQALKRYG